MVDKGKRAAMVAIVSNYDHKLANPQALYLARALAEEGIAVTFVAPLDESAAAYLRAHDIETRFLAHWWPRRYDPGSLLPKPLYLLGYALLFAAYCVRLLLHLRGRLALIIAVDQTAVRAAWILQRLGRTDAYVAYILELWDRWALAGDVRQTLNKRVWDSSTFMIVPNEGRRRFLEKHHPYLANRVLVLENVPPNAWPGRTLAPVASLSAPLTLGYVGSIGPETGLKPLLAAIATVEQPVRLLLAGKVNDPRYEAELRQQVDALNLQEQVSLLGPIPRDEIPALVQQVHVTVCFYPWRAATTDVNYKLCAPNKVYESLALGRPVLASDNPTLSFLPAEGAGWTVNIEEGTEALRAQLSSLASDLALVVTSSECARDLFLTQLNFEASVQEVKTALLALVPAPSEPASESTKLSGADL
jgi:glycosyltransferase involved in cell wall biosynthesis